MADSNTDPAPRVLVLGSDGYGRGIVSHRWNALPDGLNVADYEVVVLDFATLQEEREQGEFNPVEGPPVAQFVRLSFSDGTVYAIGEPSLPLNPQTPAHWWFPIDLDVVRESGDVVQPDKDWEFWFKQNRGFSWVVRTGQRPREPWTLGNSYNNVAIAMEPIATTRYESLVAIKVSLRVSRRFSGPSIWLPKPTGLTPREAVMLLLREGFAVGLVAEPPQWIAGYRLPDEATAYDALQVAAEAVGAAEAAARQAATTLALEQRFRPLLYATGDELENAVHEALGTLGATVEPATSDKDDGRIVDPAGRSGLLEVKGIKGQVGVENVRQLQGWAMDAETEGWEGKAILVANAHRETNPSERSAPVADSAEKFAAKYGAAIVTTEQIFEALRKAQAGEDLSWFWDGLFETDGLSGLPSVAPTGGHGTSAT